MEVDQGDRDDGPEENEQGERVTIVILHLHENPSSVILTGFLRMPCWPQRS